MQGAYDVLSDPEKRKQYDAFGSADGRPAVPGRRRRAPAVRLRLRRLSATSSAAFGGGSAAAGGAAAAPASAATTSRSQVTLSFEDSLEGVETQIPVELETACHECGGSGAKPGTAPTICPECRGRGVIAESQGLFALSHPCPRCRGNGTVIEKPCPTLPRHRPRAAHEALQGEDPRRRQGRHADPAQGQGRARLRRRPAGRSDRRHARRAVDALRAARRPTSWSRSRSRSPTRRSARRSRCRRPRARSR